MTGYTFNKITSTHNTGDFLYTAVDYIAEEHVLNYILHQNANGWTVVAREADDRPADADRTYNPAPHLLEGI